MKTELLLHVARLPCRGPAVAAALAVARRLDARVDGMYVVDMLPAAFTLPEAMPLQMDSVRQRSDEARAAGTTFDDLLAPTGIDGRWRVAEGDVVPLLCHAAAGYDWLIMERGGFRGDAPVGFGNVSRCVFGSSKPVLVVPEQAQVTDVGRRVLLAWNGSRQSALAIHAALPLLERADSVWVLDGRDDPYASTCSLPSEDIGAWLRDHGITAETRLLTEAERLQAGPSLLAIAGQETADLLVMGAWGRSRLSEMVLGGTTRHLFMNSAIPMLVAH
jgi:nucleotide-binding universal stress UspA family protein